MCEPHRPAQELASGRALAIKYGMRTSLSDLPRRVSAAKLTHGLVELVGLLEVADVTTARDHDELRVADRLFELACDAEWELPRLSTLSLRRIVLFKLLGSAWGRTLVRGSRTWLLTPQFCSCVNRGSLLSRAGRRRAPRRGPQPEQRRPRRSRRGVVVAMVLKACLSIEGLATDPEIDAVQVNPAREGRAFERPL
jgi:hypothetical protein